MSDEDKAITQMNVLSTVYFGAGIDIREAILQLGLNEEKYLKIAKNEGISKRVIQAIEETIR